MSHDCVSSSPDSHPHSRGKDTTKERRTARHSVQNAAAVNRQAEWLRGLK